MTPGSTVQPAAQICTAKQFVCSLFPQLPMAEIPTSFHSCPINEYVSIRNRVVQERKHYICEEAVGRLESAAVKMHSVIRSIIKPKQLEEYGKYAFMCGGKQGERYQRSLADMEGAELSQKYATVYAFVKVENWLLASKGCVDLDAREAESEPPDPRCIQAASDQLNMGFRTFVGPIEAVAYPTMTEAGRKAGFLGGKSPNTFGKGLSSWKAAQLLHDTLSEFREPVVLSVDASRADAHLHAALHKAKFKIYEAYLNRSSVLAMRKMQRWYTHPKCRGLHGCKYTLGDETMLRSGYMDTSLANNTCFYLLHCLYRDFLVGGETWEVLKHKMQHEPMLLEEHDYQPLVNGDDTIPVVEARNHLYIMSRITEFFGLFGVDLRIEGPPAHRMEDVEWCQARPVELPQGWRFVRNPAKVMTTLAAGPKFWLWETPKTDAEFTRKQTRYLKRRLFTVAVCEKSCSIGVPVLQALCDAFISMGEEHEMSNDELKSTPSYYRMLADGGLNWRSSPPITEQARASFERAFGITRDEQLQMEEDFKHLIFPSGFTLAHVTDDLHYTGPPSGQMTSGRT